MSATKEKLNFPYEFHELEFELNEELKKYFRGWLLKTQNVDRKSISFLILGNRSGFIQVGPEKYLFPKEFKEEASKIYNFEVRPSDIWIVTYPRSGNDYK